MKVRVYRNLHKKCWSVKHQQKVIAHKDTLMLSNVTFKVSQAGRNRVLTEKKKNVHAFVCGDLTEGFDITGDYVEVTYNPYKYQSFVIKATGAPITGADYVIFTSSGACHAVRPRM